MESVLASRPEKVGHGNDEDTNIDRHHAYRHHGHIGRWLRHPPRFRHSVEFAGKLGRQSLYSGLLAITAVNAIDKFVEALLTEPQISASAIWTAFNAAPLRMLSPDTNRHNPFSVLLS